MNKEELRDRLKAAHIAEDTYSLDGGLPSERLVLESRDYAWFVYYSERGHRTGERRFEVEEEACDYFWWMVSRDRASYWHGTN